MLVSEESVFLLVKREGRRQQDEGIAITLKLHGLGPMRLYNGHERY